MIESLPDARKHLLALAGGCPGKGDILRRSMPGMGSTYDGHTEIRGNLRSGPVESPLVLQLDLHRQPGWERTGLNNPIKTGTFRGPLRDRTGHTDSLLTLLSTLLSVPSFTEFTLDIVLILI